ncbi:protease [Candidatus Magnetoovum chiemensis]|nr:protease [Candidatus Magnetoovum chiemensis]
MYGASEVDEASAPQLYSMVRSLAQKAAMPMPKVYIMNEGQPNAFATGRSPSHAAVAVTTGIMDILSYEELSGVLAHELSHIRNRDILIGTIASVIAGAIGFLANFAMFFGGSSSDDEEGGGGNIIASILIMIFAPMAAMLIQMAISRSREYMADEGGARLAGNPRYLAGALRKLSQASAAIPMRSATPATSHMFIVNPLTGGGIAKLFSTHPPIEERIDRLESMTF